MMRAMPYPIRSPTGTKKEFPSPVRQGQGRETKTERGRLPTLPHCCAVPSAQAGLTSLFGMGRGGTPPPKPPLISMPGRTVKGTRAYGGHEGGKTEENAATGDAPNIKQGADRNCQEETLGQLVALGFGVAAFTPAPY